MTETEHPMEAKLRELIGPRSEEERHRRILNLIGENVRLRERVRELEELLAQRGERTDA